jgi:uncharacterized cupin superfamily protein
METQRERWLPGSADEVVVGGGRTPDRAGDPARDATGPCYSAGEEITRMTRPPFLISTADVPEEDFAYPDSEERHGFGRAIGHAAGLERIGLNVVRVPPGRRTSYPHAEGDEEEFVYVLDGEIDAWIDGHLHHLVKGDLAAFPAGTGVCHTFLNDGESDALLLVGGERDKPGARIYYARNQERKAQMRPGRWWEDIPLAPQGPHDGHPRSRRP